jgi:hypothetical protein
MGGSGKDRYRVRTPWTLDAFVSLDGSGATLVFLTLPDVLETDSLDFHFSSDSGRYRHCDELDSVRRCTPAYSTSHHWS